MSKAVAADNDQYLVDAISELPGPLKQQLAIMALSGWTVQVSAPSIASNRWWTAMNNKGRHVGAVGGLKLVDVVPRLWREFELAKKRGWG